jgi:hypothetical protein
MSAAKSLASSTENGLSASSICFFLLVSWRHELMKKQHVCFPCLSLWYARLCSCKLVRAPICDKVSAQLT